MKTSAHYISGTHWDREWYRPFQEYRVLLVQLLDELLTLMETSEHFRYFQLDGQTCVLQDYMEVRPENRERLQRLISDQRILIGPWFTMPDLFCVGDEALIRNLLLGRRISTEWGVEPMPVGFICDMFGHPSQIAQLFTGFGYHDCVLGRGTNEHTTPSFFTWEAPDGSRVLTFKLQDSQGYGAFALPRAMLENPDTVAGTQSPNHANIKADLDAARGDARKSEEVREKWARVELARYINHETARANAPVIAVMDSMDHIPPAGDVARYLRLIRESCPDVSPAHSTLPMFFDEARRKAKKLPIRRGELREPSKKQSPYLWLIPNCLSARVSIKLANDACQNLLEKWVEPLLGIANLEGADIPGAHLRIAWQNILTNHAHDTICGCSIDQVHRDMMYRFDQARVLGDQLRHRAVGFLTARCADLAKGKDEFTLSLVNPLPRERDEVVVFDVDFPLDYPYEFADGFTAQRLKAFTLEDEAGHAIPFQRLSMIPKTNERSRFAQYCFVSDGEFTRYTIAARLTLPACGFTSLRVKPSTIPVRTIGSLRTGPAAAQNEHLAVAIESNGTLTLTDKTTGQVYRDLLTFEDRSEVSDGWFHGHSLNDEQLLSTATTARVGVLHDGPEVVTFRVVVTMMVPASYDTATERPGDRRVEMAITNLVSLRRGARVVDVETTVDNTAEDHRLRVLLPTDCAAAKTFLAHHPYDFVERPIALDPQTATWQEMEQAEKPFLGMQAVAAGKRGLAIISGGGLHEGGVFDDARRTMAVTLLRSFRKTIGTGGEPDGLEKSKRAYRFALMPFAGTLPRTEALSELAKLQAGLITRQTGKRPSGFPPMSGDAPATQSFVGLQHGRLVVSAIKPAEDGDGLIVRLWNPTDRPQSDALRFWRPVKKATGVQLDERPSKEKTVSGSGRAITIKAAPHRIVTVRVAF